MPGVVPTITNVDNVSIVTASFPERHGITSNTYYDRDADERAHMIDPEPLGCETGVEFRLDAGDAVAALVAKRKPEATVGHGCDVVASAGSPPEWLTERLDAAPDTYSGSTPDSSSRPFA